MSRLALLVLLAACDVGSVLVENGPDGGGGGGGGSGAAAPLTITVTSTPTAAAVYAPQNVVAVWVTNQAGQFIKTIERASDIRTQYLVAWSQASGGLDVDSVSGATRTSHATPLTIKWGLKDRQGQVVPDGTYTIRMETADQNSLAENQNNQGTFTFIKGATPEMQQGLSNGGFTNVTIAFNP